MQKVPTQKSSVSIAVRFLLNQTTSRVPAVPTPQSTATARVRVSPRPSCRKAMAGCNMESELVIAARKRRKNQRKPTQRPSGMCSKTSGRVLNPSAKVPPTAPAAPRKIKAAGMVIMPPSDTSKNSLPATAVVELKAMSSSRRM